jgi:putative efflux protein, MATE family
MFGKAKEIDMIHGPVAGKILLFAIPLMCSSILQLLFNAADVVVLGRFAGDNSLAAVGSTSSLVNLIVQLFIGLSVGGNVITARAIGEGKKDHVGAIVRTAVTTSLVSGIFLLIFGILIAKVLLKLMDVPEEVLPLSTLYMRIYFCGMPCLMLYNFGSALLRAKGDTRRPLLFLMFAGVINVCLNCLFVIVFHMDVAGVALATVISQAVSGGLVLRCLCREKDMMKLDIRHLGIDIGILKKMMRIGLPAGIQGVVFSFSNVIIQSSLNSFGAVVMAGSAAASSVGDFIYVSMNAFHQTALSFNGQNMGAARYDRVDKVTGLCIGYVVLFGTVLSIGAYAAGPALLGIYSTSAAVIAAGMVRMRNCTLFYEICGIMDVMPGCIRGMGYSILPMAVSILGSCVLRLGWVATVFQVDHTVENLYLSYPVSWVITFAVHIICYMVIRKRIRKRAAALS